MFIRRSSLVLASAVIGFVLGSPQALAIPIGGNGGYGSYDSSGTGSDTECSFDGQPILLDAFDNDGVGALRLTDGTPGVHAQFLDGENNNGVEFRDNGTMPDTIVRNSGDWDADGFIAGMKIAVKGTSLNDSLTSGTDPHEFYTIDTVSTTVLTLAGGDQLTNEGTGSGGYSADATIYSLAKWTLTGQALCRQVNDDGSRGPAVSVTFDIAYNGINRDCFGDISLGHPVNPGCLSTAFVIDNPPHTIRGRLVIPATSPSAPFDGCIDGQTCTLCVANPPLSKLTPKVLADFYPPTDVLEQNQSFRFTEYLLSDGTLDPTRLKFDSRYAHGTWLAGEGVTCPNELELKTKGTGRNTLENWSGIPMVDGHVEATSLNVASDTGQIKYTLTDPSPVATCDPSDPVYATKGIVPGSVRLEGVPAIPGSEDENLGNGDCRSQFDWGAVRDAMAAKGPFIEDEFRTLTWTATLNDGTQVMSTDSKKIVFNYNETVQFTAAESCFDEDGAVHNIEVELTGGAPLSVIQFNVVDTRNGTANKQDYSFSNQALSFDPNDTTPKQVPITIKLNNPSNESDETVILKIVDLVGPADLGTDTHTVTIVDSGNSEPCSAR
jgi:hypothetical protein